MIAVANSNERVRNAVLNLQVYGIEAAPVASSISFGPCLLSPGIDWTWTIGQWDGEGWYSMDGFPMEPQYWASLPATF